MPGPKVDCADFRRCCCGSLFGGLVPACRFYLVGYDGKTPVYFGHFGVRTATGQWAQTQLRRVRDEKYADYSTETPAQYGATWPQ